MICWMCLLFLIPTVAFTETVTIRSGEHEMFSRLVMSIGIGTEWDVTQTTDGYLVEISEPANGFDTARVFERIPRTRIKAVQQRAPSTLFLAVDCDCHADAFLWRPGQLVLDIVTGSAPDIEDLAQGSRSSFAGPYKDQHMGQPTRLPNLLELERNNARSPASLALPTKIQSIPEATDLQVAEAALIEGLARAATQGFLDPALRRLPDPTPVSLVEQDPDSVRDPPDPRPMVGTLGIGISTAMDREFAQIGGVVGTALGQQCLSDDLFSVNSWADDRAFHDQAASLAEALAGEFGAEPREAQDALAKLYLYFGFGAEARAVLAADPALSQSRQILVQLAGIVDDYPGGYPLIADQAGCPTAAAVWAFYVNPVPLDDDERSHVLRQFFAIPQPLRGHLAPRFARKFVGIDDLDAAEKVMRAPRSNDADTTHDVQATRALIAEEIDDPEQAIAVLSREADDNARISPESLIRLIELSLEQGSEPKESDLILAAVMRQEFRNTPIAADLAVAEAGGWIQKGQYHEALDLMNNREDMAALDIVNQVYAHLAQHGAATIFLEFGFNDLPERLTSKTRNGIGRRMIELGFPERATALLIGPAEQEEASERRYLRAEAAIGTRNYETAIDEVLGLSDERARDLRSRAYSGLGDHRAALAASAANQTPTAGTALQFRAGAWDRLTAEDDDVLSAFAQAFLRPNSEDVAETLADRRAILAQSEESRRAIEELLLRFNGTTPQN